MYEYNVRTSTRVQKSRESRIQSNKKLKVSTYVCFRYFQVRLYIFNIELKDIYYYLVRRLVLCLIGLHMQSCIRTATKFAKSFQIYSFSEDTVRKLRSFFTVSCYIVILIYRTWDLSHSIGCGVAFL